MADYKAVVVGAGVISSRHIKAWQRHPDVALTAVADINPDAAAARAKEFGIPTTYGSYAEMFEKERPDLVSVCTWMITHADICEAACRAGAKGIWSEKPLAGSLEEVDRILAAADGAGTKVSVGHHGRFQPLSRKARQLIAQGAIGEPSIVYRRSGGGLLNNGTHAVDAFYFLLGDAKPVWALGQAVRDTDRYERKDPIEDCCGGIVAVENGCRLVLESDLADPRPPGGQPIVGSEGILMMGREGMRLMNRNGVTDFPPEETDLGYAQAEAMIDWLAGRIDSHPTDAHTNRTTIETLMGIYESARQRKPVTFPLASGPSPLREMISDGSLPVKVPGAYDIRLQPG